MTASEGTTIRRERSRCGMSVEELAAGAEIDIDVMRSIEDGTRTAHDYQIGFIARELRIFPSDIREECDE